MSLPWNRPVRMRLAPDEVRATWKSAWPRSAAAAEARCSVEPVDGGAAASQRMATPDLDGLARAVGVVLKEIATHAPAKGRALNVELSSALLHLDVVEGDLAGHADRQLADIATACAAEVLGDTVGDHEIRSHLQRDGRRLLIAAIGRPLLAMLSEQARACGMRLVSATPEFVAHWNAHGHAVKPGESVFAVSAARDLSISTIVDGTITAISIGPPVDLDAATQAPAAVVVERAYAKPITSLLASGSAGKSRGAFSPSRPATPVGADALDLRVDRMLVASGRDPKAQSTFVLVAPDAPSIEASTRWSTAGPRSARA